MLILVLEKSDKTSTKEQYTDYKIDGTKTKNYYSKSYLIVGDGGIIIY